MQYLCTQHREVVLQSISSALHFWQQWMEQGQQQVARKNTDAALAFLGCAYEISHWLLGKPEPITGHDEFFHIDRFILAGKQLSRCYASKGRYDVELHLLLCTHHRLCRWLEDDHYLHLNLKPKLHRSMAALLSYAQQRGMFAGYEQCRNDTHRILSAAT